MADNNNKKTTPRSPLERGAKVIRAPKEVLGWLDHLINIFHTYLNNIKKATFDTK